jgi:hypothetical protein
MEEMAVRGEGEGFALTFQDVKKEWRELKKQLAPDSGRRSASAGGHE